MRKDEVTGAPPGVTLGPLGPDDLDQVVTLLEHQYWNADVGREVIARAQLGSQAWVGARDETGRVVASARAISDGAKCAWIYDVIVDEAWRGRGVGRAVFQLLLDHPVLRDVRTIQLGTRDAQSFYEREGFVDRAGQVHSWTTSIMMRRRS